MNNLTVIEQSIFLKEDKFVIKNGQPWVTSMYIQEVTGKTHDNILKDIRKILDDDDIEFNLVNFNEVSYKAGNGQLQPMFLLSEDGSSVLLGGYSVSHRKRIQKELREFKNNQIIPQIDSKFMKQLANAMEEKERQVLLLTSKIKQDQPKVLFAESVTASQDSVLVHDLATILKQKGIKNMGEIKLFAWLRDNGYLCKSGEDYNLPTSYSMNLKLMEIKKTTTYSPDGSPKVRRTPKITGKGQVYFVNKFLGKTQLQVIV